MKNIITTKRGFSLVELLVALSILAVVAAIIVPRFLNVRDAAVETTAEAQVKELNNIYSQWVALGGQLNGGTAAQVLEFLSTSGVVTSATRLPVANPNPLRDATGSFGSANISMSGITVNATAAAITASSGDGFLVTNGTPAGLGNAGGLVYKSGNVAFGIPFSGTAATPFGFSKTLSANNATPGKVNL